MTGIQRRIAAGLLALGTFASIGGTASASEKVSDYNERYENTIVMVDNPCTPEFDNITLDAQWHLVGKTWVNDDGSWWYQGSNRGHVSGSAADGTEYGGSVHFQAQTRVVDGIVNIVSDAKHKLVSQGDAPNFTVRWKIRSTFALDGTSSSFEVVKEGEDCHG